MISSEVQRTLVKSPPELWAELSDPAALSRHLGEFGEIRIVRTDPERSVEWAAENAKGTVSIKPSGWGTTVKLTVTREIPPAADPDPAPAGAEDSHPAAEPPPEMLAGQAPTEAPEAPPAREIASAHQHQHQHQDEREPRRGFFARLFGRGRRANASSGEPAKLDTPEPPEASPEPVAEPARGEAAGGSGATPTPHEPDAFAAVRRALAPETFAATHLFAARPGARAPLAPMPAREAHAEPKDEARLRGAGDISAELRAAEEAAATVLTGVLDRLGAAHHRPFSRA
jgi:hypothetical protein